MDAAEFGKYVSLNTVSDWFLGKPKEGVTMSKVVRSRGVVQEAARQSLFLARYDAGLGVQAQYYHRRFVQHVHYRTSLEDVAGVGLPQIREAVASESARLIIANTLSDHYDDATANPGFKPAIGWILPLDQPGYDELLPILSETAQHLLPQSYVLLRDLSPDS